MDDLVETQNTPRMQELDIDVAEINLNKKDRHYASMLPEKYLRDT